MFVVLQFPITDVRCFLTAETSRIPSPSWPLLSERDFLRYSGPARQRRRGGVREWTGEERYCSLRRALRLPDLERRRLILGDAVLKATCVFRRFFFDGTAVARAEVAFDISSRDMNRGGPASEAEQLSALLEQLLSITVSVPASTKPYTGIPLIRAGHALSQLYLSASTKQGEVFEKFWATPGELLILVQSDYFDRPLKNAQAFPLPGCDERLWHGWLERGGRRTGVWFLPDSYAHRSPPDARFLRISLLRWHGEMECVKEVIRGIASGRIPVAPGKPATERLEAFLNLALRRHGRSFESGLPRDALMDLAWRSDDLVKPGEAATVVAELQKFRRQVANKVKLFIAEQALSADGVLTKGAQTHIFNVVTGGEMKFQNIGSGAQIGTNVQAEAIQNSFNVVKEAAIPDQLRQNLTELIPLVQELSKQLGPVKGTQVTQDLQTLVNEAVKESPRQKWYELSADGLVEAAKAVASLAGPVTSAVRSVVALLSSGPTGS